MKSMKTLLRGLSTESTEDTELKFRFTGSFFNHENHEASEVIGCRQPFGIPAVLA